MCVCFGGAVSKRKKGARFFVPFFRGGASADQESRSIDRGLTHSLACPMKKKMGKRIVCDSVCIAFVLKTHDDDNKSTAVVIVCVMESDTSSSASAY